MTKLRKPEDRECERCGRRETWDDDRETWVVADETDASAGEGDAIGDVHCVHEWDIDGSFQPIE